jgi:hypothetical protein
MTRANLNFIGQKAILFHYHNGDQYPEGLVDYFGLADFCRIKWLWEPADFQAWISKNYTQAGRRVTKFSNGMSVDMHVQTDTPAEAQYVDQPCIYYTGSFPTDYSYVFKHSTERGRTKAEGSRPFKLINYVLVYHWSKLIFEGTPDRLLRWIERRREPSQPHVLPAEQSLKATIERSLLPAA